MKSATNTRKLAELPVIPKEPLRLKNTDVTNKAHTKAFLLDCAKRTRHHKFTRVSEELLEEFERASRAWLLARVNNICHNPSKGVTLR